MSEALRETDAQLLRRFIHAAAKLEPDLARWAAAAVWRGLSPSRRRQARDEILREAARLLPPASTWQRAHTIADLTRRPEARPGVSTAAELVALATAVYRPERGVSASQIFRVLVSRISPVEMEVGPDIDFNPVADWFSHGENDD